MEIESTLTRITYVKLMVLKMLRSSIFYFIIAIIFGLFLWVFLIKGSWIPVIGLLVITILYYTLWILYTVLSPKNRIFFEKKYSTFNDDNIILKIIVKASIIERVFQWEAFESWEKVAGYYLLHSRNKKFMFVIGKSDIPTTEIGSFENLLRRKIDEYSIIIPTKGN